jgi:hypothetical protein
VDNRLDLTIDQIYQLGKGGDETLATGLERVYNATPLGPLPSNMVNTIYGINHRQTQLALPFNRDGFGLTFFTRPRMNLTTNNIRFVRQMYPLLNTEPRSIQRIIRTTLDPQIAFGSDPRNQSITSPYVDVSNMFIPLLSNLCLTISGWPDFVVDTHTTPEGHYRESHSMVDSSVEIKNTYELSASFRNIPNNPVTLLFFFWLFYMAKVFEGEMIPYGSSMWETEIDYNTRIYRLILDPTKRYVQHILATGAAFPLNAPVGALGNFDNSQPYNEANDNVNIRFQCIGMDYNDPISVQEFNAAVVLMNPGMEISTRDSYYIKIPYQVLSFFNMRGYPQINTSTMELEWYITYSMFQSYAQQLAEFSNQSGLRDQTFLQYISSGSAADYKNSLAAMDNNVPANTINGGLIQRAQAGEFSQDQLDQISQAYFTSGG